MITMPKKISVGKSFKPSKDELTYTLTGLSAYLIPNSSKPYHVSDACSLKYT